MGFLVKSSDFNEAVKYASSFTSPRICDRNIKVSTGIECLTFSGCDGSMWASRQVDCESQEIHEFMVDPMALLGLASTGSAKLDVKYNPDNHRLMVSWGDGKVSVKTTDTEDWPQPRATDFGGELFLNGGTLQDGIKSVSPARLQKGTGVAHENLFLESSEDDKWVSIFATDGTRLHRFGVAECVQPVKVSLTPNCVKAIQAIKFGELDSLSVSSSQTMTKIETSFGYSIVAQVPSTNWPDGWRRVVEVESGVSVETYSNMIESCLSRSLFTRDQAIVAKLTMGLTGSTNRLVFTCNSINPPFSIQEGLPYDGEDIGEVRLLSRFLIDAVRSADTEKVRIVKSKDKSEKIVVTDIKSGFKFDDGPGFVAVMGQNQKQ